MMDRATCPHCKQKFCSSTSKRRHMKTKHGVKFESKRKRSLIFCPLCTDTDGREGMLNYILLKKHLRDRHNVLLEEERLTFPNREDFEKWRKLEHRNVAYMTARTKTGTYMKVIHYNCNRSNCYGYKSTRTKYREKKGGSIKIDGICPSRITADFHSDGQVAVHYIKTHVGHAEEVRTQRLTHEEQRVFAEQLKAGVSPDRIIEEAQKIDNGKVERKNLVNKDDFKYIRKKYNIEKSRDPNDMIATFMEVRHQEAVRTQRLTHEQTVFAEQIKDGVMVDRIIKEAQKIEDEKVERKNLVQKDDFKYIRRKKNVEKSRDPNDMVTTFMIVEEENIDDETRMEIRCQDFMNKVKNLKNLGITSFNKCLDELETHLNKLQPNTSTKKN